MDEEKSEKIKRIRNLKSKLDAPKTVGEGEIVPFAWRNPLQCMPDVPASKVFRALVDGERTRNVSYDGERDKQ